MKKSVLLFLTIVLSNVCSSQEVEPYGNMTELVTMIFNEDMAALRQRIFQNIGLLQGVEVDRKTGKIKIENKPWRPNSIPANEAQMEMESITVWWMPPKPAPQKISNGGSNIKPVRSEIWIVIGCLKTNHQASVIRLRRQWIYNALNHFPYTEIPVWRSNQVDEGSYPSDYDWLRKLAPEKVHSVVYRCLAYDSQILEILKTLPSKKPDGEQTEQ